MRYRNTFGRAFIRYIVFQDRKDHTWYAVALEFNIVESGDDPQQTLFALFEAIRGYIISARKTKARPAILNQKPDPEYERIWNSLEEQNRQRVAPYNIFATGRQPISA